MYIYNIYCTCYLLYNMVIYIHIFPLTFLEEEVLNVFLHACTDNRHLVTQHQETACATSHSFPHEYHRKGKTEVPEWCEFSLLTFQEFFSCSTAENTILNQNFFFSLLQLLQSELTLVIMITQEKQNHMTLFLS